MSKFAFNSSENRDFKAKFRANFEKNKSSIQSPEPVKQPVQPHFNESKLDDFRIMKKIHKASNAYNRNESLK